MLRSHTDQYNRGLSSCQTKFSLVFKFTYMMKEVFCVLVTKQVATLFFKEVVSRLVGSFSDRCRLIYGPGVQIHEHTIEQRAWKVSPMNYTVLNWRGYVWLYIPKAAKLKSMLTPYSQGDCLFCILPRIISQSFRHLIQDVEKSTHLKALLIFSSYYCMLYRSNKYSYSLLWVKVTLFIFFLTFVMQNKKYFNTNVIKSQWYHNHNRR